MDYSDGNKGANASFTDANLDGPNISYENIDSMILRDSNKIMPISRSLVQNEIYKDKCNKQEQALNKGAIESPTPRHKKKFHEERATPTGFEAVLKELGNPGRYVFFQVILNLLGHYALSSTILIYVFIGFVFNFYILSIGYEPPHTCQVLANESELLSQYELDNSTADIRYGKCSISLVSNQSGQEQTVATLGCFKGHDYKGQRHISFVSEWDLVCEHARLREFVQTIMLVGQFIGAIAFTSLADKLGRKPIFLLCNVLLGCCSLGIVYAPNIYVMIALRFFTGLFQQGSGLVSYTILMEWVTSRHRRYVGASAGMNWSFTVMVLSLTAYIMRDHSWRSLQLVAALFALNVLLNFFLLTESPRWLIDNNRHKKALKILQRAAKMSGANVEKVIEVFNAQIMNRQANPANGDVLLNEVPHSKVERYTALDLLHHKVLLVPSLIIWFTWVTNSLTYYGLMLTSSSLAGNRYLNFFLMNMVEIPAEITNFIFLAFFGRKRVLMFDLFIAGTGLCTSTLLMALGNSDLTATLSTVFSLVGKFGITACFNGLFIYTPELFPTNLRSAGIGVCSCASTLGGMIAPYAQALADLVLWGPGLLFSAMCWLSMLMFNKLTETRGRPMPATLEEMKERARGKKHFPSLLDMELEVQSPTELQTKN